VEEIAKLFGIQKNTVRRWVKDGLATTDDKRPMLNPHSFRNTLFQLGQKVCKTPEQFKAWSQNLGHEKVLTTFLSYGEVMCHRQGEIILCGLCASARNLFISQRRRERRD
jgi:hypothetical protein